MEQYITASLLYSLAIYFALGLIGGFSSELYRIISEKSKKIRLVRILLSAITTMFVMNLVEEFLIQRSAGLLIGISFLIGVLGVELFGNLTSFKKLSAFMRTLKEFKEFKNTMRGDRGKDD